MEWRMIAAVLARHGPVRQERVELRKWQQRAMGRAGNSSACSPSPKSWRGRTLASKRFSRGSWRSCPRGLSHPEIGRARISYQDTVVESQGFEQMPWNLRAHLVVHGKLSGTLEVVYLENRSLFGENPFILDEKKLVELTAQKLGHRIESEDGEAQPARPFQEPSPLRRPPNRSPNGGPSWTCSRRSTRPSTSASSRRLMNHLTKLGVPGVQEMIVELDPAIYAQRERDSQGLQPAPAQAGHRRPRKDLRGDRPGGLHHPRGGGTGPSHQAVDAAGQAGLLRPRHREAGHLPGGDLRHRQPFLPGHREEEHALSPTDDMNVRVALIRRFLTDSLPFIRVAKEYLTVHDFGRILARVAGPAQGNGTPGRQGRWADPGQPHPQEAGRGKSPPGEAQGPAHLVRRLGRPLRFRALQLPGGPAELQVLQHRRGAAQLPLPRAGLQALLLFARDVRTRSRSPWTTWVRARSSSAPPAFWRTARGRPSRASTGASSWPTPAPRRSGWRPSSDAVAEVYASIFGPDPIQYRAERGLLDFMEEMGIIIQRVVGRRVGKYFFPAFAGVAFCNNEFRWSPRIKREDGILRIVAGLGTRAVDRIGDDFPVLVSPGQARPPGQRDPRAGRPLRPEATSTSSTWRRAASSPPASTGSSRRSGTSFPYLEKIVSIYEGGSLRKPMPGMFDPATRQPRRHLRGAHREHGFRHADAGDPADSCRRPSACPWIWSSPTTENPSTSSSADPRAGWATRHR